jgi:guanylate cyclase
MEGLRDAVRRLGVDPADPPEIRDRKTLLVIFALLVMPAGVLWGLVYLAVGQPVAATAPIGYVLLTTLNLAAFARTKAYAPHREAQLLIILLLPFFMQLALGGFATSSAVVLWSVIAPFGALVFSGPRGGVPWAAAFVGLVAITALLDPVLPRAIGLPEWLVIAMFAANIAAIFVVAFSLIATFMAQKDSAMRLLAIEQERSESLLLNVLPREIAPRLKAGESPIADAYENATVIFADIVGFTPLSAGMGPEELVSLLNTVFCRFDELAERHGVEKIRTIGDNYMAVAGVPRRRADHAQAIARLALDMRAFLDELRAGGEQRVEFRIGIGSGPMVGGVIGLRKFVFDIWGDPVNTASRMESHGVAGRIQVTDATYELLKDEFAFEPRGTIDVKGKGPMRTWFLVGQRSAATQPPEPAAAAAR